jgi:transforming growth factor-beta-induced protein
VQGVVYSSQLKDGLAVNTLSGLGVTFLVRVGGYSGMHISVNASDVTTADISASNGVIHVIDRVILPSRFALVPPTNSIGNLAIQSPNLSYLLSALKTSGLAPTFFQNGTFTVFAPVDSAFTPLIRTAFRLNPALLVQVLKYHVLTAVAPSTSLFDGLQATTLGGDSIRISESAFGDKSFTFVNDAQVILADNTATNGVVHFIDRVLFPPGNQ